MLQEKSCILFVGAGSVAAMKLDRNIPENKGRGKYALIKLRGKPIVGYMYGRTIIENDGIDYGDTPDTDFFVIRLKDAYAAPALAAYAMAAYPHDPEYAVEILNLSKKAAEHPNKQTPD